MQIDSQYLPSTLTNTINFYNGAIFNTSFKAGTIYKSTNTAGTNPPITNLFFNNTTITTKEFNNFSVNYNIDSRGKFGAGKKLMDINTTITSTYDSTISFKGFPIGSATITINTGTGSYSPSTPSTSEMYTANNKLQGYYLISPKFSETFNPPAASESLYTMNLVQKWYNPDGTTANTTASQTFYYDAFSGNPSFGSSSYTNTSTTTNISGISVIGATPTFTLSINVTNLYKYFYVSPVLKYEFIGGCITTQYVLNLANYSNTTNTFTLSASPTISPTFNNTQTLNVTANNLNGSTGPTGPTTFTTTINAIYDNPSYTFITDPIRNPTSIQEISAFNSVKYGFRVWSNKDTTDVNPDGYAVIPPPYKYKDTNTNISYSYYRFPYDQSWSIINNSTNITSPLSTSIKTSQEIQIYNGHYGTGTTDSDSSGKNGYIIYSSYYNNSLDYSVVSRSNTSYRYTTFVWKIIPPSSTINFYKFTFNKISATSISTNSPYTLNGNQRFFLFYKTEQVAAGNDTASSIWIDGNSTSGTKNINEVATIDPNIAALTSANYNVPYDNTIIRAASSTKYTINGGNLVAEVSPVTFSGGAQEFYIYCRFGNSMNYNITYESVTLSLLSQ